MGRNKHSIAKEIDPESHIFNKWEVSLLGNLSHMIMMFLHMSSLRNRKSPEGFEKGLAKLRIDFFKENPRATKKQWKSHEDTWRLAERHGIENDEPFITDFVLSSIRAGDSQSLRDLADTLDMLVKEQVASPLEPALTLFVQECTKQMRAKKIEPNVDLSFTVSQLKGLVFDYTKKEYTTAAVREAAKRVGISIKDGRGRPKSR